MIRSRKPEGGPTPGPHRRATRARSEVRSAVEHVLAERKARMGPFVRAVGRARAHVKIGVANPARSMRRRVRPDARTAAA